MLWTITNHQFNHHPTRVKVMDVVCCHKCCSCLNPPSPLATPWSPTPPCPTTCESPVPQTQSTALPTRAATLSAMSGQDTPSTWLPNTWNGRTNQKNLTIRIDYVSYTYGVKLHSFISIMVNMTKMWDTFFSFLLKMLTKYGLITSTDSR